MASPKPQRQTIPFGHNSAHFVHIHNNLVAVLTQIKAIKDLRANILWVSCRLNRSGAKEASPVFAGWVEETEAINMRVKKQHLYAPIDIRFGDTHRSTKRISIGAYRCIFVSVTLIGPRYTQSV